MASLPIANNFLAGSILSLVLPIALLLALCLWYMLGLRRIPEPDPETTLVGEPVAPTPDAPGPGADPA